MPAGTLAVMTQIEGVEHDPADDAGIAER